MCLSCAGELSLEQLQDLPYCEAVIKESGRMLPLAAIATREANEDMLLVSVHLAMRWLYGLAEVHANGRQPRRQVHCPSSLCIQLGSSYELHK